MRMRLRKFPITLILVVILGVGLPAKTHFTFTSNTGNNMTILVKTDINPDIEGSALSDGDEIGVFTPSGLCVGAVVWQSANAAITVWGDNEQTDTADGIESGAVMMFGIWDSSASKEVPASVTYSSGGPKYAADGIAILSSLNGRDTTPVALLPGSRRQFENGRASGSSVLNSGTMVRIGVCNIRGQKLYEKTTTVHVRGNPALPFKTGAFPNGHYLFYFQAEGLKTVRYFSILH